MERLWSPWRSQYIESFHTENEIKCVFCKLLSEQNDIENLIVDRGERFSLIMNRYPYNSGHLMVISNSHISNLNVMDKEDKFAFLQNVESAMDILKHVVKPHGFNIGLNLGKAAGAGVEDHIHFHIVPRWIGDTNFMPVFSEVKVISEEMGIQLTKFRNCLKELNIKIL
jgi:ATP adenylyltransferase